MPREQRPPTSKTNAAIGTRTATNTCAVQTVVIDATNSLSIAKDVVTFAERMHRRMGIPVSVERCIIAGATVLAVSSGDVVNSRLRAIATAQKVSSHKLG